MAYVHLVIVLALLEFMLFGLAVGSARARYKVPAPATAGHEVFERYFRVQMNTLEQLVVFLPSIWLFGHYSMPGLRRRSVPCSSSAARCISAATRRHRSHGTRASCSRLFRTSRCSWVRSLASSARFS